MTNLKPMIAATLSRTLMAALAFALAGMLTSSLWAQGPSRGGSGRDRGRSFDPGEMLRRLDEDHNGKLEGKELEGRGGDFARRLLTGTGMQDGKSISVDAAADAIKKAREKREAGVESASMSFGTSSDTKPASGFDAAPPVAGKSYEQRYGKSIVDMVMGVMGKYDANKNHFLDGPEWKQVQWKDDPVQDDKNKDGRLSIEELCERVIRTNGSKNKSSKDDKKSDDRGKEANATTPEYAKSLLRMYDRNKSGFLEKEEWSRLSGNPIEFDKNKDGKLSAEELAERSNRFIKGKSGGDSGDTAKFETYRFLSPTERLPKGLPDWFTSNDKDADGQIMMHEFSSIWTAAKATEFDTYDLNHDGIITPNECLDSAKD